MLSNHAYFKQTGTLVTFNIFFFNDSKWMSSMVCLVLPESIENFSIRSVTARMVWTLVRWWSCCCCKTVNLWWVLVESIVLNEFLNLLIVKWLCLLQIRNKLILLTCHHPNLRVRPCTVFIVAHIAQANKWFGMFLTVDERGNDLVSQCAGFWLMGLLF